MNFRIGCAVWAYKGWLGDLFPAGSRSSEFLRLYSQRFTAVEGNTTFYSIPDTVTIQRWAADTPPNFQFCLKLPKSLTHQGPLQPHLPDTLRFLDRMQGLGSRLGPLLAQLPPNYGPTHLADLEEFLTALSRQPAEFAVEVRHPDWFRQPYADRLTELLTALNLGRVLLDTRPIYDAPDDPQLDSERRKPKLPLHPSVTAPFSFIRFISHPDLNFNQPYLEEWVSLITRWLQQGTRIYFFVHCPLEERSPTNARHFYHLLQQQVPIPPLPWNQLQSPPAQLELF